MGAKSKKTSDLTRRTKIAWVAVLAVFLLACQKDDKPKTTNEKAQVLASETLKAIDRNLGGVVQAMSAVQVSFEPVAFDYAQDGTPKVAVQLAKIEPIWIERVVNQAITNDNNHEHYLKFTQSLNDRLVQPSSDDLPYQLHVFPVKLPPYQNIAQFAIDRQEQKNGEHQHTLTYLLFDMDYQSQIGFDDVFLDDGDELLAVLHQAFDDYLLALEIDEKKLAAYKKKRPLFLSKNVYFAADGLTFVYPPDTLADVEQGFVKLTVPYDKLHGLIKARYLPTTP